MLDGEVIEELRRCSCCEVRRPMWAFTVKTQRERSWQVRSYRHNKCRSCSSGNSKPTKLKRSGAPIEEVQKLANLTIDRIRRKDGFEPWDASKHRPERPVPSLDEYVAARQERFERAEEAPKVSRQVRRAAERRIVKDAVSASKRVMTDVEVVKTAIGRAMAAKSRSAGGTKNVRRTVSKKAWALDPAAVGAMLKAQGYRCALTGERFQESTGYGVMQPFAPSPNRINPGGDYTIGNAEFVCWWVNRLIGDMPRDLALEFLRERGLLNQNGRPSAAAPLVGS